MPLILDWITNFGTISNAYHEVESINWASGSVALDTQVSASCWLSYNDKKAGRQRLQSYSFKFDMDTSSNIGGRSNCLAQAERALKERTTVEANGEILNVNFGKGTDYEEKKG